MTCSSAASNASWGMDAAKATSLRVPVVNGLNATANQVQRSCLLEQLADGVSAVDACDGVAQERRYRENRDLGVQLVLRQRDGVGNYQLLDERRIADARDSDAGEDGV